MNKAYRLIWSSIKNSWVIAAEIVRGKGIPAIVAGAVASVMLTGYASDLYALPQSPQVINGQASFATLGNSLTVTNSDRAIINWNSFNINPGEITKFIQPTTVSSVLNRVTSTTPSALYGTLQSNGKVYLVNQNGIFIGPDAKIDTQSFIASTLNILDSDFIAGKMKFSAGPLAGKIENQGTIRTPAGGSIYLIAPDISNSGIITAPNGDILLAAGHQVHLVDSADPDLAVVVSAPDHQVLNLGQIIAAAGKIGISGGLIAQKGRVSASSAVAEGGKIFFKATKSIELADTSVTSADGTKGGQIIAKTEENGTISGTLTGRGTISAQGDGSTGSGGFVETSAAKVDLTGISVNTHGGNWLIDPDGFTIAATGGDISGATLSSNLTGGAITVFSTSGAGADGNINVNDTVSWSANKLTLNATNNININSSLNGTGTASLALEYGQGAVNAGNTATYNVKAPINLPAGPNFSTKLGSDGATIGYTVITSLGLEGSVTGADLQGINGNLPGNYALGSNIDASATSGWNTGAGFVPIGDSVTAFTGNFDGLGHTITNLYINRPATNDIGLFGYSGVGSVVSNVGLKTATVTGFDRVGSLVGNANGAITNSYTSASVTGRYWVGGLLGTANSTIGNVHSTGVVSGQSSVGGLVGSSTWSTISDSYSSANVSATGPAQKVGGFVGDATWSSISNSYSTGSVSGSSSVGGFAGAMDAGGSGTAIANSFSTGSVTGSTNTGGFIGINAGVRTIDTSYWDTTTSGQVASAGGTGLTTAQMMTASTYAAWDTTNTWGMIDGISYPYLTWQFAGTPQIISGSVDVTGGGRNIQTAVNGTLLSRSSTGANGFFYQAVAGNSAPSGSNLLAYIQGDPTYKANAVTVSGGSHVMGLSLTPGSLTVSNISDISAATFSTAKGGLNFPDILYSVTATPSLDLGTNNLKIIGSNPVTQSIPISAAGVELSGNTTFTLDNTANSVSTLAGNVQGSVLFKTGATPLTIGTVNTTSGLTSSAGGINVTADGSLQISTSVNAPDPATGYVWLQTTTPNGVLTLNPAASITAGGSINLDVAGTNGSIVTNPASSITSTAGSILLTALGAGGSITSGADYSVTALGSAMQQADTDITVTGGAFAGGGNLISLESGWGGVSGNISITGAITADSDLKLNAKAGTITQSAGAAITGTGHLDLIAVGSVSLKDPGNNVVSLSGSTSGNLEFFNSSNIHIAGTGIQSSTGSVMLGSPIGVDQQVGAPIIAGSLGIKTDGSVNLSDTGNNVGTLAVDMSTSSSGTLDYSQVSSALSIGSVGTTTPMNGITTNSAVTLGAQSITNNSVITANGSFAITPTTTFANSSTGTIELKPGSTFTKTGGFTNDGVLKGSGTFDVGAGNALINNGTIAPGNSTTTGTLTVSGNLVQGATGVLDFQMNGTVPGQYDALAVIGTVQLGGMLNASLGTYTPFIGDFMPILTGGPYSSGTFTTVNAPANFVAGYSIAPGEVTRLIYATASGGNVNVFTNYSGGLGWGISGNWSKFSTPVATDNVIISSGYAVTHATGNDTVNSLNIDGGSSLDVSGGLLRVLGTTMLDGVLSVSGNGVTIMQGSLTGGTSGQVNVGGVGALALNGSSSITTLQMNGGTIGGGGTLAVTQNFSGTGGTINGLTGLTINHTASALALGIPLTVNGPISLSGGGNGIMVSSPISSTSDVFIHGTSITTSSTGSISGNKVILATSPTGTLNVGSTVTATTSASLEADTLLVNGLVSSPGEITIRPQTDALPITVGQATCNVAPCLVIPDASMARFDSQTLVIGSDTSVTGTGFTSPVSGDIYLGGTTPIDRTASGRLVLLTGGGISQDAVAVAPITANYLAASAVGGAIDLATGSVAHNVANVSAKTGSSFALNTAGSITVSSTSGGNPPVTIAGITAPGGVSITSGNSIFLQNPIDAGTGAVTLTAIAGEISDLVATAPAITGGSLAMNASTGIGTMSPIKTQVALLDASNGTSGKLQVSNTGAFMTGITAGSSPVSNTGDISITAHSPLTINSGVLSSTGNVTLTAGASGVAGAGDNLTINGPVRAAGTISLSAGDSVTGTMVPTGSNVVISANLNTPVVTTIAQVIDQLSTTGDQQALLTASEQVGSSLINTVDTTMVTVPVDTITPGAVAPLTPPPADVPATVSATAPATEAAPTASSTATSQPASTTTSENTVSSTTTTTTGTESTTASPPSSGSSEPKGDVKQDKKDEKKDDRKKADSQKKTAEKKEDSKPKKNYCN